MHAMHVNFIYRYTLTYYNTLKNLSSVDVEAILVDEAQNTPPSVKPKWWLEKLKLPNSDLTRLQSGAKLTDTLMNAAQKLLLEQFPFCQSLQDVNLGTLLMFSEINSVDDAAVQILHTGNSEHWVCVAVSSVDVLKEKSIEVLLFDSLWGKDLEQNVELQICCIFGKLCDSSVKVKRPPVQQQQAGTSDCGLFAVAFATDICHGRDPTKSNYDQSKMGTHLRKCLEAGKLTPFPQLKKVCRRPAVNSEDFYINIYCYCHMPEYYDTSMIQCSRCLQWFHKACTEVNTKGKDMKKVKWSCCYCVGAKVPSPLQKPTEFQPKFPAKKHRTLK
jgi:hypothetical protein